MMTPVGRLLLVRGTPRQELVSAMAWLTIPALIGPIMGPPLGGFLTTYLGWHWVFWINVPIGLLGLASSPASCRRASRGARGRSTFRASSSPASPSPVSSSACR